MNTIGPSGTEKRPPRWLAWLAAGTLAAAILPLILPMNAEPDSQNNPPAASDKPVQASPAPSGPTKLATFGGGCFWCTEAVYERIEGVKSVVSGYSGGKTVKPTYKEICNGDTGHAEVIQIEFDPTVVSYKELLEVFWMAHDPTTLNRQGNDTGTQYRSVIFYHDDEQKKLAEQSKMDAAPQFKRPIVTEISKAETFYPAEDYHQDYFAKNPQNPYCNYFIPPNLIKLKKAGKID